MPFLSIVTDGPDATSDVYGIGKVMFIGIIGVVSWEIALISRFWTWIFVVVWGLSYAVTFPFLWALGALFQALHVHDSSQVGRSSTSQQPLQSLHILSGVLCLTAQCWAAWSVPIALNRYLCSFFTVFICGHM